MSVSVATIYVNDEKVLKIIDTSTNPQIASVHITASENTIRATFTGVGGSTSGFNCILDCEIYNTNYTYNKVSNFELVITSPVLLEPFEGDATIGNNSTINLVYNPYNITTSKPKIVIHCEGKSMADNLVITNEIYMGEFEEIEGPPTLTLIVDEWALNINYEYGGDCGYSLDGGSTWNAFTSTTMVFEGIEKIRFRNLSDVDGPFTVRTSADTSITNNIIFDDLYDQSSYESTEDYIVEKSITLYFIGYN